MFITGYCIAQTVQKYYYFPLLAVIGLASLSPHVAFIGQNLGSLGSLEVNCPGID